MLSKLSSIIIKNEEQIAGIRKSSKLAGNCLKNISSFVREGVSTGYLNDIIETYIRDHEAIPAPLNYKGFPKASCISLNEVICHGIPNNKTILNIKDLKIIFKCNFLVLYISINHTNINVW